MKKFAATHALTLVFLCGCAGQAAPQSITLEAGNHELLSVLCRQEGLRRIADPNYYINITDNDNWDPFYDGAVYEVEYEIINARSEHREKKKSLSIAITDTTAPILICPGGVTSFTVPYTENPRLMDSAVLNGIKQTIVAMDNSSTSSLRLTGENLFFSDYDPNLLDAPQTLTISVEDPSGNQAEILLEMTITQT